MNVGGQRARRRPAEHRRRRLCQGPGHERGEQRRRSTSLPGCTQFSSDVGVDDSAAGKGSVTFSVLADGAQVASTGVMRGGQPAQHLTANVTGVSQLTLDVGDAGDGIGHDNGDWGDAKLMCAS